KSFHQLANILILPLEYGSGYYWEVWQIYLNTKKKKLTSCATVYLECTQHENRQWQRPENMPQQHALVQYSHQLAHEHPQYRQSSEIYEHLQQHGFINAKVHTKEQQGFKVVYYVENNFVRALGFTTILLDCIGIKNVKEVVIDSTFKTNQE
ncbi:35313_t:CDS:2, partial [Gigaspora margarita]